MKSRNGLTLIELLMVITILVTVTAAALPMLTPDIETRRIREATRGVSAFLGKARAMALASGDPVGVEIAATEGAAGGNASFSLFIVETPPPFSGLTSSDTVQLTRSSAMAGRVTATFSSAIPDGYLRPGDRMQVNNRGTWYTFLDSNPVSGGYLQGDTFELVSYDIWPAWPATTIGPLFDDPWTATLSSALSYSVTRQPMRAASAPYTLPTGAAIDIAGSGIGIDGQFTSAPVRIMYLPNGSIDSIQDSSLVPQKPMQPTYLLVGKFEKISGASGEENWRDLDCRWVVINNQNGQATSAEMAQIVSPISALTTVQLSEARRFAQEGLGMGGR